MTDGWCPVDDRVFATDDGICPQCGTQLVALAERRPERSAEDAANTVSAEEPETQAFEEDDRGSPLGSAELHRRWALFPRSALLVLGILAGILAASLWMLFVRSSDSVRPPATTVPDTSVETSPSATRHGQLGLPLRLDGFSQRGGHVVVRVSVPSALPIGVERLQSVSMVFFAASARYRSNEIALPVRATSSGFVAEGDIDRSDVTITDLNISSLTFRVPSGGDFRLDLSGVWPAPAGPRSRSLDAVATVGGRRFRLSGIVGWPDRIEARFEVRGEPDGWYYADEYFLVIPGESPTPGIEADTNFPGRAVRHIVFEAPPDRSGRAEIKIRTRDVSIQGAWSWELRPRSSS